jgi:hypothetical protein
MLLVDNDVITTADLVALDPEVTAIADAEQIILEGAGSVIRQTWEECAAKLMEVSQAFGGGWSTSNQLWTGLYSGNRPRVQINQIITSHPYGVSPLTRWLVQSALVQLYLAAVNRRDNDRYEARLDRARGVQAERWRTLWSTGLPFVLSPLACPGASHESAGEFTESNLSAVAGGAGAEATYEVAITWADGSAYVGPLSRGNAESGPSKRAAITVPASNLIRVSIAGLIPPGSVAWQGGTAEGLRHSRTATGWNVYVGTPGGAMYLQNNSLVPVGTETYTLEGAPNLSGYPLHSGQVAEANLTFQATLQRG